MSHSQLIDELVQRANVSPADADAVLAALLELAAEGRLAAAPWAQTLGAAATSSSPWTPPADRYVPCPSDVEALIAEARRHPLGIDFLLGGHLGTVAVAFKTHAFTVEAARERIWTRP